MITLLKCCDMNAKLGKSRQQKTRRKPRCMSLVHLWPLRSHRYQYWRPWTEIVREPSRSFHEQSRSTNSGSLPRPPEQPKCPPRRRLRRQQGKLQHSPTNGRLLCRDPPEPLGSHAWMQRHTFLAFSHRCLQSARTLGRG